MKKYEEEIPDSQSFEADDELFEHYRVTVDKNQEPLRIDKFLFNRLEHISRTKIQTAAEAGCILVNQKPVRSSYKIKPGDLLTVVLPHKPDQYTLLPENIPLNIVYEDDDLIVINKPAGMVVHPGVGNFSGTLANALLYHFMQLPKRDNDENRPGLVHRIDKNTSGILLVAKTDFALSHLTKQFFDHSVTRTYVALVWGEFEQSEGTISGQIGRHPRYRKLFTVFEDGSTGKHAVTHYKVLEQFGYTSLVECKLETGRTHQIRVHMQHIGHPIFSDETYGGNKIVKGTVYSKYRQFVENCFAILPRQALHAMSLGFIHPVTGKYMFFSSALPADMEEVIGKWRNYADQMQMK
jgi:23S rRNA pseudouridine1911/1915/1917 synthase